MNLTTCPDCKHYPVSRRAERCPKCGCSLDSRELPTPDSEEMPDPVEQPVTQEELLSAKWTVANIPDAVFWFDRRGRYWAELPVAAPVIIGSFTMTGNEITITEVVPYRRKKTEKARLTWQDQPNSILADFGSETQIWDRQ